MYGTMYRTMAQIRKDEKIAIEVNKDSVYKPVQRVQREFPKLVIPAKLQEVTLHRDIYLLLFAFYF